jgi:hypothetical protein
VLVVTRFSVAEADGEQFAGQARAALGALAARPGYLRGHLGRAIDDPSCWLLLTEWDGVGAYRRALSAYDVRVQAIPVLALGQPEPGAFEVLTTVDHAGAGLVSRSDRAADADTAGPGAPQPPQAAPPAQPTQPPRAVPATQPPQAAPPAQPTQPPRAAQPAQAASPAQPTQLLRQGRRPEALDQPGGAVAPDPLRPDDPTGQEMP